MFSQLLWVLGTVLGAVLSIRCCVTGWHRRCPVFLAYLSWISFTSALGYCVYHSGTSLYPNYYWFVDFVALGLGYGVIWELAARILRPFPGARRMASAFLSLILVAIACRAILNLSPLSPAWHGASIVSVERYFRFTQAILLSVLACVMFHFKIPFGPGFGGIFLGFGCYTGTLVVGLAARVYLGGAIQQHWQEGQQLVFLAALLVWCRALWKAQPLDPASHGEAGPYSAAYLRTARLLAEMRRSLLWQIH